MSGRLSSVGAWAADYFNSALSVRAALRGPCRYHPVGNDTYIRVLGAQQLSDVAASTSEKLGNVIETFVGASLISGDQQGIVQLLTWCTLDNNPLDTRARGLIDGWAEGRVELAHRDGDDEEMLIDLHLR